MDDVYRNRRYLELADQIENHSRTIGYLLVELNQEFPPENGDAWIRDPTTHRPTLMRNRSDIYGSDQHGI